MVVYNVSIKKRIATLVSKSSDNSVNGNKGDEVHFTFDSEWEGQSEKVALFVWGGKYYPVEFTGNVCQIPPLYNTNNFRLGVYVGETTDSATYLSSTEIEIPCKLSIRDFANSAHGEFGKNYTYEAKGYAESAKRDAEIAREFAGNTEQIEAQITRNDKRITNLEQGLIPSPFVTDNSVAYIKDIPLNALPYAEVSRVGGMTYKDGDILKSAKVTELKIVGANLFNDIGWFNTYGFTLQGDGSWLGRSLNTTCFTNTSRRSGSMYFSVVAKTEATQEPFYLHIYYTNGSQSVVCGLAATSDFVTLSGYTDSSKTVDRVIWTYSSGGSYYIKGVSMSFVDSGDYIPYTETSFPIPNEVQSLDGYGESNPDNNTEYNYIDWDRQIFVAKGHIVDNAWVAFDTKKETDISKFITADNYPSVKSGGRIIAVNEYEYAVPSEITYQVKGATV